MKKSIAIEKSNFFEKIKVMSYVVHVAPIARGIRTETLSYFTLKTVSPGDLVLIPLRSKEVPAIVVLVESATSLKGDIKDSSFELKK